MRRRRATAPAMVLDDATVDALALRVLDRVRAAIVGGRVYSTRRGERAPGYGRDDWRQLARAIGTKRGRYWFVTAAQLDAFEHPPTPGTPANGAQPWHPAQEAAALGLRTTQ